MSTTASNNLHIPSKPPSPASPTSSSSFNNQQSSARSFINLNGSTAIRGQTAPFPTTPTTLSHSPMEPPPGMLYSEYIRGWTDADVARWLNEIRCGNNAETFKANDIRGDILLELDQATLKEMGVSSIGDRLRIVNAVKILRQKAASKVAPTPIPEHPQPTEPSESSTVNRSASTRRLESGRPAPLQLSSTSNRNDLPRLVREHSGPDSANTSYSARLLAPTTPSTTTPVTSHTPSTTRSGLPQVPPPPRGQPPVPPSSRTTARLGGRRTPTPTDPPALTSQPLPPAPATNLQPPTSSNRPNYHLPADPRPGSAGGRPAPPRAPSPNHGLPPRTVSRQANITHNRNGSGSNSWGNSNHPYANASAALQPHAQQNTGLSPIAESFATHSSSPSPPVASNTNQPSRPTFGASANNPSLDDLRRYIVKFVLPEEGQSCKINIQDVAGGVEILEKVLKKLDKGSNRSTDTENHDRVLLDGGGLSVDGWSVYMDRDGYGPPLTEAELLSICHTPDHLAREQGLILRRTARTRPYGARNYLEPGARNTKRASSISILSELGVRDPERALEPPSSNGSVWPSQPASKKPSKLRNFFGQRPPSELITNHLTEYFPYTEKRVLERTARNSMMRTASTSTRRDSTISSISQLPSRFSVSTQGSAGQVSASPPRASISSLTPSVSEKHAISPEEIPRVSLSTEDGQSIDLPAEHSPTSPHVLPPIPFSKETLSESLQEITSPRLPSRASSTASRRASYMTELRSKKDRSDTASLMTVDQITAEVESRRESLAIDRMAIDPNSDIDEWTKVGLDEDTESTLNEGAEVEVELAVAPAEDEKVSEEEGEDYEDEDEDGVLEDEDETGKATTSSGRKWIKGALIGAGSFGQVYLGMDASNGLLMAVKQVELPKGTAPNEERKKQMLSALEREIELLKDLQHDNIVQYLYSSLDGDHLNIFLEYVPGGSVSALLRNYGAFEEPLVKNFVRQILLGLNYLHERDIIHRDIKGANILVDNKGGIKISDFGISKKVETHMLMTKSHRISLQGSVFWMAPEVVKQTAHDSKADIWSVGCLVVEMFTGEHPWAQLSQMQAIFKIGSSAKPAVPSDISAEAQDFLAKTFDIKPEQRPSAAELLLHPWLAG